MSLRIFENGVLALPEVRALFASRALATLVAGAAFTVLSYQVYALTRDPLSLGWLGLVEAIPSIGFALFGGHVADRGDRRTIAIVCDLLLIVFFGALALFAAQPTQFGLMAILIAVFLNGIASGFYRPAISSFVVQVIPPRFAAQGASLGSATSQAGFIAGPALGGILIAAFGVSTTYVILAVLSLIATSLMFLIAPKPIPPQPHEDEGVIESLKQGVRYVLHNQYLLASMALDLFAVLFGGAVALLPVFASDILHVGPTGLGVLRTAPSVGALLIMLANSRRPITRNAGRWLFGCVAAFGVTMIVFGLSVNFWLSLVALLFSGVFDGVSMVIRDLILRANSPEHMRGRIAAVNWVFIGASNEIGAFESGVAARLLGTVPSVVVGGCLTLLIVGTTWLAAPKLRALQFDKHGNIP